MKNPVIVFVLIIVVLVFGVGTFLFYQSSSNTNINEAMKKDEVMIKNDKVSASRYVEYNKQALDDAKNSRRVLFFYASWCPTCKPADISFRENSDLIPQDLVIIRVNYNDPETSDEEKELAKKYGITYQHTFVQINNSGEEVTKWNGGGINELLTNIK